MIKYNSLKWGLKMKQKKLKSFGLKTLLVAIAFSFILALPVAAQEEKTLKFNENKEFIILQIADTQDIHRPKKALINMINSALDKVKPDLVVYTGDQILGRFPGKDYETIYKNLEIALDEIISPVADRKIPFAFVYGNHDDNCGVSKEEQMKIYQRYDGCLAIDEGKDMPGCGTYNLPILSSDGNKVAYNLWMLDSKYEDETGKNVEAVSTQQIVWYLSKSRELENENNGEKVPSLMFQHIPVREIYELLDEVDKSTKGAVEKNGKYYILNEERATGILGEGPCPVQFSTGQMEALIERQDVVGMVFGHDHINSFIGNYEGIDLIQSPGCSFLAYGDDSRGMRVFTLNEDDLWSYETEVLSYYDIVGNDFNAKYRRFMDADEKIPLKIASFGIVAIGAIAAGTIAIIKNKKKGKDK